MDLITIRYYVFITLTKMKVLKNKKKKQKKKKMKVLFILHKADKLLIDIDSLRDT